MNILVNAIPLSEITTGIQRYARCLYTELQSLPNVSISYLGRFGCGPEMPPQAQPDQWSKRMSLIRQLPDSVIVGLRVLDRMHYERRLRSTCRAGAFDVFHETAHFPPVTLGVPVVYTFHDLSLMKHREKHPRERVWFSDLFFARRLPHAAHIITVSHFIRNELIEELNVPPDMVTAIPLAQGVVHHQRPRDDITAMLDRRGWPREYILFVGTLEPRKNLALLIKALSMTKTDIPLLLAGWAGWGDKPWLDEIGRLGLRNRVVLTGYADDETLACLYNGASALVYPSLYEGFGLPVLEAMACGCPVLCSNCSSLPEVAGDAAMLIDPHDPAALADSLDTVLHDSTLRQHLIEAGLQRSSMFSWNTTALKTLEIFKRVSRLQ